MHMHSIIRRKVFGILIILVTMALAVVLYKINTSSQSSVKDSASYILTPSPSGLSPTTYKSQELIDASEKGDSQLILRLLKNGADINSQDKMGRTPVMAATHKNRIDTVKLLISEGADVNIQDNQKDNPFLYSAAEGHFEILKLTIDVGADTRLLNRFGGTALIPAAERGNVEIVNELLERTDVDINHVNNLGWTALLEAIILGEGDTTHTQIVRLLVDAGANVNISDKNGTTPLSHARQKGFTQISGILETVGAN